MNPVPRVKDRERSRTKKGRWRKKRSDVVKRQKREFLEARKNDILDKIETLQTQLAIVNVLLKKLEEEKP